MVVLQHKKFTTEQYHQMVEAGILTQRDRVELIEGEIIQMAAIGRNHAVCVNRLTRLFTRTLPLEVTVQVQNPIQLSDASEPEPDFAILRGQPGDYLAAHPSPEDILALVEVSDSTLVYDRTVKAPLYARAGIQELWIVALEVLAIAVYRLPGPAGYGEVQTMCRGQSLAFQAFPEISFTVEQLLADFMRA